MMVRLRSHVVSRYWSARIAAPSSAVRHKLQSNGLRIATKANVVVAMGACTSSSYRLDVTDAIAEIAGGTSQHSCAGGNEDSRAVFSHGGSLPSNIPGGTEFTLSVAPPAPCITHLAETKRKVQLASQMPLCGTGSKKYTAFLSHHKKECAMEARYLKSQLEAALGFGSEVFLDSDDLQDMRLLLNHVRDSDCIVLLQSAEVLTRPWCLLELCTAVEAAVPIVAVTIRGKGFNFADARRCLTYLDTELDRRNPGATDLLRAHGFAPQEAAYLLSNVVPNLISVEINPYASKNVLLGSLADLVEQVRNASPVLISKSKMEWLESRDALRSVEFRQHGSAPGEEVPPSREGTVMSGAAASSLGAAVLMASVRSGPGGAKVPTLAPLPLTIPPLPKAYCPRPSEETALRKALFSPSIGGRVALLLRGPETSGKTVLAASLARDHQVRMKFDKICFLSVGKDPDLTFLRMTLYEQLTGVVFDEGVVDDEEVDRSLLEAAIDATALVIVDGVAHAEHTQALCGWLTKGMGSPGLSSCAVLTAHTTADVGAQAVVDLHLGDLEPSLLLEGSGAEAAPSDEIQGKVVL